MPFLKIPKIATAAINRADFKAWAKITTTDEDTETDRVILDASERVELATGRLLESRTVEYYADGFPPDRRSALELVAAPVTSVTSVKYWNGTTMATWDSAEYYADLDREPARLAPLANTYYPTPTQRLNAVNVTLVAGYSTVPERLIHLVAEIGVFIMDHRGDPEAHYSDAINRQLSEWRIRGTAPV